MFVEYLGSRAGSAILSLGTFVVVTRGTPIETAGVFISAISYALLLYGFLDLGTGPHLVRTAIDGDHKRKISEYVWTRVAITAAVVAVGAVGVLVFFPSGTIAAGMISLIYVATSINGAVQPVSQVIGDAKPFRLIVLLQGLVVFLSVTMCVLWVDNPSAELLVATYGLSGATSSAVAYWWLKRHMEPIPLREVPTAVSGQFRAVALLAFASGATSIYLRIDQSIVLKLQGAIDAAFYGVASRINIQARMVPSAVQLSISTFLAQRVRGTGSLSRGERRALTRVSLGTGIGLSLSIIAIADLAVRLLAGPGYADAVLPCVILAVSLVSTSYNYVVGTSAVMAGFDRRYLAITGIALVFNVAANFALIPVYGLTAAAIVAAATETAAVMMISFLVGSSRGAVSASRFVAALAIPSAVALLKIEYMNELSVENLAVSVTALVAGLAAFAVAFKSLGALETKANA